MTLAAVHEVWSPPTFQERVAALVGSSTYRTPAGSRSTGSDHLPAAHAVAAALAFVKRGACGRAGEGRECPAGCDRCARLRDNDIGPDVAICIALGTDAKRGLIIAALAQAMKLDRHPLTRRNVKAMGYVANVAFDVVVHGRRRGRIDAISKDDWDMLVPAACRILEALADAALAEAEGCWRRRG